MRPHILLLTTGGTIASLPTAEGLAPGLDGEALAGLLPQGIMDCYDITIRDILHLDSSNIQPEEWQTIARHVFENRMEYSGIVITHGTDTMAYTASVLSFMLRGISIPVVLTGAQLPMAHPLSDGMENLRTALAMAASGVPGVFLAFDRKVILGCRAVKTRTTDFDAFESVNWPLAANVDGKGLQIHREAIPAPAGACALRDKLCDKVFLIKLTPGLDPEIFDMLLQMHYRGIVIEAFGAGGLHFVRRDLIAKLQAAARAGMTVVVCSQCLMSISLASDRGNTRKGGNSASLREPGHIANIRHKLGTKGIPHAAHSHDDRIFGKLRGQGSHFCPDAPRAWKRRSKRQRLAVPVFWSGRPWGAWQSNLVLRCGFQQPCFG